MNINGQKLNLFRFVEDILNADDYEDLKKNVKRYNYSIASQNKNLKIKQKLWQIQK